MKVLFLHLSDIHFTDTGSYSDNNIKSIVAAMQPSIRDVKSIVIVVSGDIANSGTRLQYSQAEEFFNKLMSTIQKRYGIGEVELLVVPGNHDVNYNIGVHDLGLKKLEEINQKGKYDEYLIEEIKKQGPFHRFAKKINCFNNKNGLIDIHKYSFGTKTVQINLFNSAIFSSLENDQGFHYFPNDLLEELEENKDSDYIISVIHHPPHWYNWETKIKLESILYKSNDIVFLGHDHFSSAYDIETKNSAVSIYAGGMLSDQGDWSSSKFYVGILDIETRLYSSKEYSWDSDGEVYRESDRNEKKIAKNRMNSLKIAPNEEYLKKILSDKKYAISRDINEYFVFPLLEEESNESEISNIDDFLSTIEELRKICILGRRDFGKSTLVKKVYSILSQNKVCIFLDGEDVGRSNPEICIRGAFEEGYTRDPLMFEKFKQLSLEEKVLIIDDVDLIPEERTKFFWDYTEANFGYIIQTSSLDIELDIKERLKKKNLEHDFTLFKLRAFYSDKREQLVTKLVKILIPNNDEAQQRTVRLLCDALTKRKVFYSWSPDFIVQFVRYYCNNIGESIQNDGDVYSKVFESNITILIKPYLKGISPDKAFTVIDKIAYASHINKEDPIRHISISSAINDYNEIYDAEINAGDFIQMLIDAGIIKKHNAGYRFTQRNYLAYFVAREIRRRCQEEGDYSEFNKALELACFGINSDIILFVTYITDNVQIINRIMEYINQFTKDWEEFSVSPINVQFLADSNPLMLPEVTAEDRIRNSNNQIKHEKNEEKRQELIEKDSIYDYDESKIELVDEMIRSVSLLSIISKVLPNFEHIMKKQRKTECVEMIYTLPLKIFNVWAQSIEKIKIELIQELREIDEYTYREEKMFETDEDVLSFLRWESMSLLLDLMNSTIRNASKDNTYSFLDRFEYSDNNLYGIEHLMELSKRDVESQFSNEAVGIMKDAKNEFTKNLVKRVTRNYIITSKNIKQPTVQKLNDKVFDNRLNQAALYYKKAKNKKIK